MEYRRLGRCGLKVSEIYLGRMTFRHGTDAAEAARVVLMALDAGVTFFNRVTRTAGIGRAASAVSFPWKACWRASRSGRTSR